MQQGNLDKGHSEVQFISINHKQCHPQIKDTEYYVDLKKIICECTTSKCIHFYEYIRHIALENCIKELKSFRFSNYMNHKPICSDLMNLIKYFDPSTAGQYCQLKRYKYS